MAVTLEQLLAEQQRRQQTVDEPAQPAQRTPEEEAAFQEEGRVRVEAENKRQEILSPVEKQILSMSQTGAPGFGAGGQIIPQILSSALGLETRTPETEGLPEFTETGGTFLSGSEGSTNQPLANEFKVAAGLIAAAEPDRQVQIIKKQFPGTEAFIDSKGNVLVDVPVLDDEGNIVDTKRQVLNKPGLSFADVTQNLGRIGAFMLTQRRGGAGGPVRAVGSGSARGAGTQGLMEGIASMLGAEFDPEQSAKRVGIEGLLGGAGEILPAIQGVRQQTKEGLEQTAKDVAPARELSRKTGITLFPEQQLPTAGEAQKLQFLFKQPETAQRVFKLLEKQNKEAAGAVESFLDDIAAPLQSDLAETQFQSAAKKAIEIKRLARKEKVDPIYNEAFRSSTPVDVSSTMANIQRQQSKLPADGEMSRALNRARNLISEGAGDARVGVNDLETLHNAKIEIDQMMRTTGKEGLGPSTKRRLEVVREDLISQMNRNNPTYEAAQREFERLTPEVQLLEKGTIGSVADLNPEKIGNTAQKVFAGNPETIKQSKKIIEDVDPEAWAAITRRHFEKLLGSQKVDFVEGPLTNIPLRLNNALGNSTQFDKLKAALPDKSAQNLIFMREALQRASLGRAGQSSTQQFQRLEQDAKRSAVGNIFQKIFSPKKTGADAFNEVQYKKNLEAMFEVFTNPQFEKVSDEVIKGGLRAKTLPENFIQSFVQAGGTLPETESEQRTLEQAIPNG